MKSDFLDFIAQAEQQVPDATLRSRVVATAIATALVNSQNLPSSEVDNAEAYFTGQLMPLVMKQVSEFNEAIIFDTRATLEQVRQLWHLRYASAFRSGELCLGAEANFFNAFTGVQRFISEEFYCFANANAKAICSLAQFATCVIEKLNNVAG